MADIADDAQRTIEHAIALGVQAARATTRLAPIGECHFCLEPLEHPQGLFCDAACAKDYELMSRRHDARR